MSNSPITTGNIQQTVPFFMVNSMQQSLSFYTEGLGFTIKMTWEPEGRIEWCLLELDAASIMLQEYRRNIPTDRRGVGFSVVFMCQDALKIYHEIISRGLKPDEPFVGNNLWVVGIKDPDGYQIFFESPTDVPEETMYSEWLRKSS